MNLHRVYQRFIADRRVSPPLRSEYAEWHHIVPRCLGGANEPSNLIRLKPEDHLFAHYLFVKMHWSSVLGDPPRYRPYLTIIAPSKYSKLWSAVGVMARSKYVGGKLARRLYGEARREFARVTAITMDKLRELARTGQPRPYKYSSDPVKKALARALGHYTDPNDGSYQDGFKEELVSLGARDWFPDLRGDAMMEALRQLARTGQPRPYKYSSDPAEKRLANGLVQYTRPNSRSYRAGFKEELVSLGARDWFDGLRTSATMDRLRERARTGQPRPYKYSSDPTEKGLAKVLGHYTDPNSNAYREGFKEELVSLGAGDWFYDRRASATMEALCERADQPRPNKRSDDPVEKRLGTALAKYTDPNSRSYREGFKEKLISLGAGAWFRESSPLADSMS